MSINDKSQLRIYVVETNGRGGMIHYAYQLCTALAEHDVAVTLITAVDYELENFPHNFEVKPILNLWKLFDINSEENTKTNAIQRFWGKSLRLVRRGWRGSKLVYQWFKLTQYLIAQRPDIIQFSTVHFPFEALFFARIRREGLVMTQICHEFERRQRQGQIGRIVNQSYANSYQYFSAIFFHGENTRKHFLSLFDISMEKTHLIVHGNEKMFLEHAASSISSDDLRKRYDISPEASVALFFGILSPTKGLPDLVQAFAEVSKQSDAYLVIAGYPTKFFDLPELRQQIQELGIEQQVIIDPRYIPIEEVAPLISLSNFVVFPYRTSTQSGALQVAYAFGRPVIATNIGGLPSAVEDGRTGYLVPSENPPALAEKMLLLFNNPEQAAEMGRYAQDLSEKNYSWHNITGDILSIYHELVK